MRVVNWGKDPDQKVNQYTGGINPLIMRFAHDMLSCEPVDAGRVRCHDRPGHGFSADDEVVQWNENSHPRLQYPGLH